MTTRLDLSNWLTGAVDYVPEGNQVKVRSSSSFSPEMDEFCLRLDQGKFSPQYLIAPIKDEIGNNRLREFTRHANTNRLESNTTTDPTSTTITPSSPLPASDKQSAEATTKNSTASTTDSSLAVAGSSTSNQHDGAEEKSEALIQTTMFQGIPLETLLKYELVLGYQLVSQQQLQLTQQLIELPLYQDYLGKLLYEAHSRGTVSGSPIIPRAVSIQERGLGKTSLTKIGNNLDKLTTKVFQQRSGINDNQDSNSSLTQPSNQGNSQGLSSLQNLEAVQGSMIPSGEDQNNLAVLSLSSASTVASSVASACSASDTSAFSASSPASASTSISSAFPASTSPTQSDFSKNISELEWRVIQANPRGNADARTNLEQAYNLLSHHNQINYLKLNSALTGKLELGYGEKNTNLTNFNLASPSTANSADKFSGVYSYLPMTLTTHGYGKSLLPQLDLGRSRAIQGYLQHDGQVLSVGESKAWSLLLSQNLGYLADNPSQSKFEESETIKEQEDSSQAYQQDDLAGLNAPHQENALSSPLQNPSVFFKQFPPKGTVSVTDLLDLSEMQGTRLAPQSPVVQLIRSQKIESVNGFAGSQSSIHSHASEASKNINPLEGQAEVAEVKAFSASQSPALSAPATSPAASLTTYSALSSASGVSSMLGMETPRLRPDIPVGYQLQVNPALWQEEADLLKRAELCLAECFGLSKFRELQQEIVMSLMQGHDVLAVMATGAGKSICYQVPGMCFPGCTLVVSPLIALMDDQVQQLHALGIGAACISQRTSLADKQLIFSQIRLGQIKFLYLSPEKLNNSYFLREISQLPISFIAIDEAHCVSQWGHDFRPDYTQLWKVRKAFNYHIPILACTATARENTRNDIIHDLQLDHPVIYVGNFDRENIRIRVIKVEGRSDRQKKLLQILEQRRGSEPAIIYCFARKTVEDLTDLLIKNGIKATRYHAKLSMLEREKNQADFMSGKVDVIVATVAFGMGINKSNIRIIIHWDYPSSLENYYQEIGRAGRDGLPAVAILFDDSGNREWRENLLLGEDLGYRFDPYQLEVGNSQGNSQIHGQSQQDSLSTSGTPIVAHPPQMLNTQAGVAMIADEDAAYLRTLGVENLSAYALTNTPEVERSPQNSAALSLKKLNEVFDYADSSNCRKRVLLGAFNQILSCDCGKCDNCNKNQDKLVIREDIFLVIGLIRVFEEKLSFPSLIRLLTGKLNIRQELQTAYQLADKEISPAKLQDFCQRISKQVDSSFLAGGKYWSELVNQLVELGCLAYDKKYHFLRITNYGVQVFQAKEGISFNKIPALMKYDQFKFTLIQDLERIRRKVAEVLNVRYDSLISDPMLEAISNKLPTNETELLAIDGFTKRTVSKLGKYIIAAVANHKTRVGNRKI